MKGNDIVTKKLKNQLKNTATDTAFPLDLVSKNSAVTNRGMGPQIKKKRIIISLEEKKLDGFNFTWSD